MPTEAGHPSRKIRRQNSPKKKKKTKLRLWPSTVALTKATYIYIEILSTSICRFLCGFSTCLPLSLFVNVHSFPFSLRGSGLPYLFPNHHAPPYIHSYLAPSDDRKGNARARIRGDPARFEFDVCAVFPSLRKCPAP